MIQYNKPYEVTREQHQFLAYHFRGIIAHRQEKGRYWIKQLWPGRGYAEEIEKFLNL